MKAYKWWEVALVAAMVGSFMAGANPQSAASPSPQAPKTTPQPTNPRVVALTFDDGPSPQYTPKILHLLTRYDAHATFFVLGTEVKQFPQVARDIARQGSVVANHGYRHVNYFNVGVSGVARDAAKEQALLNQEKIPTVPFYRPPYGNSSPKLVSAMSKNGYTLTLWSLDTRDWASPGTSAITRKVLKNVEPGSIILMHDGGGNRTQTVQALAAILPVLKAEGYRLVTLPQYVKDFGLKAPSKLPLPETSQTGHSQAQAAGAQYE